MKIFDSEFKEIFSSQIISLAGGIIAGIMLAVYTNKLLLIPGILILLPGFLEMRGNISGSFSSRITSGLFLGVIKPNKTTLHLLKGNLIASFILAAIVSLVLGVIAFLFNYITLGILTYKLIFLSLIAGIIANTIEIPMALFATFYLFKKGHDPNNIMIPFMTSTGDIISIFALLITLLII